VNAATVQTYIYDRTFFRYIQEGSTRSAQTITPLIANVLGVKSVLDVGCGAGAWLKEYRNQSITDYLGVDGEYVDKEAFLIPAENFHAQDITQPFDLRKHFDLAQCLEVGEHIPHAASETLVANLVNHSKMVLFSAAVRGQGGENHINEQPYEFWRALFARHGYKPFDFVRPAIKKCVGVESWYRHNILLYVAQDHFSRLPLAISRFQVPDDRPIADVSGPLFRLRTKLLASFPVNWLSKLAILKHSCVLLYRSSLGQRWTVSTSALQKAKMSLE
jgi:SAM-dependent methyltransferase